MNELYEKFFVFWRVSVSTVISTYHPCGWCRRSRRRIWEFNIGLRREKLKIERRFVRRDTVDCTSLGGGCRFGSKGCERLWRNAFFFDGRSMSLSNTRR